ncbi:long-subunit fatty acid transport protein [Shimia isoporae]|uniref:Long-subunit fatty acid transport protein n=1 Tax=Shimia isoporae TaxID=647720 RepID=A0A4R1NW06_9RHOB|nr:transporter [Shimia isoporae]TCL09302.1 long-subunit fatty acid transport protein [Shimia isoporae]
MRNTLLGAATLSLASGAALAGGLDRSGQGINLIFEEGQVLQFAYSYADPSLSGTYFGIDSGDIGKGYGLPQLGFKTALSDTLDFALIYDQPFGAHVEYAPTYPLSVPAIPGIGLPDQLRADASTQALTAILRHKFDTGFSLYGGLRVQRAQAEVDIPALAYTMNSDKATDLGYLVGAAWEKPEIAARISLTYNSAIKQSLTLNEGGATGTHISEIETPQSLNLDFQTGVAANTLVFGSVRWVDWSEFSLSSPNYLGGTIVSFANDSITYNLGVGHRFSDAFSGAISLGYEKSNGGTVSDLGPSDGYFSVGIGGTYTVDKAQISFGIRRILMGDAVTNAGAIFEDNNAWAAGIQVTYALN